MLEFAEREVSQQAGGGDRAGTDIDYGQPVDGLSVLKVLGQEVSASRAQRRGNDERVPPRQAETIL